MESQEQELSSEVEADGSPGASGDGFGAPPPTVAALGEDGLTPELVGELVGALVKAARAHQIYQSNSPVYRNFISGLERAFTPLFAQGHELTLLVENEELRWRKSSFPTGEGRDSMAFLFYRDGVRSLTFRSGFQDEVELFLETVKRARQADREGDDMITLLWEAGFDGLTYTYQDMLAEGMSAPEGAEPVAAPSVSTQMVAADMGPTPGEASPESLDLELEGEGEGAGAPAGVINPDEFEETLYFLSEPELAVLHEETKEEWERDLKSAVLNALFDRLEEPTFAERQTEILGILGQFITLTLARGDLSTVARMLRDLTDALARPDILGAEHRVVAERVFDHLSEPELIEQLVRSLEDESISPSPEELALFLEHLRAPALPVLIAAAEKTEARDLRELLTSSVTRIARERTADVVELLDSPDPHVSIGAARLAGRLGIAEAVPKLRAFLDHTDPNVRLTAVEALVSLRSGQAVEAVRGALQDTDRDVRVTAVRGLASLQYKPAAAWLAPLLDERALRDADLTEKIAFFEAYAAVAGPQAVGMLDKMLNTKTLLGRRPSAEVRACAARALGLISAPAARSALERADGDPDPVVRSAVSRALRTETSAEKA